MTTPTFEDRLLAELREVVAARPEPVAVPAAAPRRRRRRAGIAGTAVAAAAAAVAIALIGGADPASPAYAVERQPDGSVEVVINSLSDASGLQAELRAAGVPAVVDYVSPGKACREPRGRIASPGRPFSMGVRSVQGGVATFTVTRDAVGRGETLVISAGQDGEHAALSAQIVTGAVAPCEVVDAPAPGTPPKGFVTNGGAGQELHTEHGRDLTGID